MQCCRECRKVLAYFSRDGFCNSCRVTVRDRSSKTVAQLLKERRTAGLTATDVPKDYIMSGFNIEVPERDQLARVIREAWESALPGKRDIDSADAVIASGYQKAPEEEALVEVIRESLRWEEEDPAQAVTDALIAAGLWRAP